MKGKIFNKLLNLFRIVKFFYGRYPKETLLRDFLFVIVTVAEMLGITIAGKFLDATVFVIQNTGVFNFMDYLATDSFYFLSLGLVMIFLVKIGRGIRENLYDRLYDLLQADTQTEMLKKISNSNLQDIEQAYFQQLQDFIPAYSIEKMMLSYDAFSEIVSQTVRFVTAFSILHATLGWTASILVVFVLPEVLLSHFNRKKISLYNENNMEKTKFVNYVNNVAQDITYFAELRVDGSYEYLRRSRKDAKYEYLDGLFHRRKHFWIDKIFGSVFGQLFKYFYLLYILAYAIIHKISIGSFSAMFNYVEAIYDSAFNILDTISMLDGRLEYTSKYFEFVENKGFGDVHPGTQRLKEGTPSLEFNNLDFAYPDTPDRKILENINFKIQPGEKVIFFGGDGSGKSSIIKVLTGLYEIIAGDYVIDGYSIRELNRGELKKKISVTFQNFINYNFSVQKNITIGSNRKNVDRDLYERVKKITGVDKYLERKGITDNEILGKVLDGLELSPGYWQRLAIARMLYRNRDVFIMDEPFTFIDAISKNKMLKDILSFIGKRRTLIYITRSLDDIDEFDRIYYFKNGHILESGTYKELMRKKGYLYKEVKNPK